jgi:hypothetical protein
MMHKLRHWTVTDVAAPEELAEKLTQHTWCCCSGFRWNGFLFLNDATSENGAQEYGVFRADDVTRQIESWTCSWMKQDGCLAHILELERSWEQFDSWQSKITAAQIQTPDQHGRCHHCA